MKAAWVSGIKDKDEKNRIKNEYESSRFLLDRFIKLLIRKEIASIKRMQDPKVYDKPNFNHYVADQLGFQRCLKEIINLIKE